VNQNNNNILLHLFEKEEKKVGALNGPNSKQESQPQTITEKRFKSMFHNDHVSDNYLYK
jgi:hypothetical protein